MSRNRIDIGFVVGLDYPDPFLDPAHEFQRFKTHPKIRAILEGGKMIEYGAKTIPGGGWFAMPKPSMPGCLLAGDSAGMLDAIRLKGVHLALKSGMLAAETAFEALEKNNFGAESLSSYEKRIHGSFIQKELWKARYFKHGFKFGLISGLINSAIGSMTNGWSPLGNIKLKPGHQKMKTIQEYYGRPDAKPQKIKFDDKLTFRKTTDVFHSGTIHEEDSPCHLKVLEPDLCVNRCTHEYGNPCQHFCPASVYEWVKSDEKDVGRLVINFANCVHCKTCDIMDPYGIIRWVPPEGGGGPAWQNL
jgi:electron-transferring-flavoprotein dehydrogenase